VPPETRRAVSKQREPDALDYARYEGWRIEAWPPTTPIMSSGCVNHPAVAAGGPASRWHSLLGHANARALAGTCRAADFCHEMEFPIPGQGAEPLCESAAAPGILD
jgi:hypothetical protein